jgi:CubicO group peptidase (beta-lactamase class C family)
MSAQVSMIDGECAPAFRRVREAFAENFARRGEVGAAVAVYHRGRPVVDLWGGTADPRSGRPWQRDTLACMMSVAKGVSATLIHILVGRGAIELDAPIARYWPEFAAEGKAAIPVRWALSHLAGIPFVDDMPRGAIYDHAAMAAGLARQRPAFAPGRARCYHTATMGFILAELIRRRTGRSLGQFLHEAVGDPFDIDYHIGVAPVARREFATMLPSSGNVLSLAQAGSESPIGRAWAQLPKDEDFNSALWRSAEIPSANGHGTARAVARLYGILALGGAIDGKTMIDRAALERGAAEQWDGEEMLTGLRFRQALGYFLNCPPSRPMGPNRGTFGHSGAGGAQSFADPMLGLGFCYAPNAMHGGLDIGPRATALINAVFASAT